MTPELSIVIVNWNTAGLLRACLESILTDPRDLECEIIVVDNASRDDSVAMIKKQFSRVKLVENQENLGFARANNQALRLAQGRFVLLLNSDAEVDGGTGGKLAALIDFLEANPAVGVIGPRLQLPNGETQRSYDLFPLRPWEMLWQKPLDALLPPERRPRGLQGITRRGRMLNWPARLQAGAPLEVDWLVGAALLARRQVIEQVGGLDERFWMYAEDLDWCYRIRQAGWQIVYLPSVSFLHKQQGSSQADPALRQRLNRQRHASLEEFYRKHFGRLDAWLMHWIAFKQMKENR